MNSQIETWRVQAYAANVFHLSQNEGSMIASRVRQEQFVGKAEFFDRLGEATAQDKVDRNSDTPNLNIDHSRRMLTTVTREWGTLVDRKDKMQNIHKPENEYVKAAMWGLGRKFDNVLIDAAFGYAMTGESGATQTALGNAQKVTAVASSVLAYPNVQLIRKTKRVMDHAKVKGKRTIVHSADFLEAMLAETTATSSDYVNLKALINGDISHYLGFDWVLCEEIDAYLASTYDTNTYKFSTTTGLYDSSGTALGGTEKVALAFAEGGLILGENINGRIARVDERSDKSYSGQVYAAQDMGGVRMEEARVVQMIYKA